MRLTEDKTYNTPPITYTDMLDTDDIKEKLQDYEKVDDIATISLGTELRYFMIEENGTAKFRLGGRLFNNNGLPNYVVLVGANRLTWCVDVKKAVFFKKISCEKLKNEYEEELQKRDDKIKHLEEQNKNLMSKIRELRKQLGVK